MFRAPEDDRKSRLSRLAALGCLGVLLLLSCATVPPPEQAERWMGVLPSPSPDSLYASLDVASSWPLVKSLAETAGAEIAQLEAITDRLTRVHARIRLSSERPPGVCLVALGEFTPGSVACRLNLDPSWQRVMLDRVPGAGAHWPYRTYWVRGNIQLAVPKAGVLLLAADGVTGAAELLASLHAPDPDPLPVRALAAAETSALFLYLPDPLRLISASASSSAPAPAVQDPGAIFRRVPIERAWITVRPHEEDYRLDAVFLLTEVENPRSVEVLLRLMLTLWMRGSEVEDAVQKLKAVRIRTEGGAAVIESLHLSAAEIASFVRTVLPEQPAAAAPAAP